jgi:hypothetical protein
MTHRKARYYDARQMQLSAAFLIKQFQRGLNIPLEFSREK